MDRPLHVIDSIAYLEPGMAGTVVVSGSHGGVSAGRFVVEQAGRPHAVFFNDAGVGKERAGVAGLAMLEAQGTIGATYSHESARIGDAADGLASGVVSHVNAPAAAAGLRAGQTVRDAVAALRAR